MRRLFDPLPVAMARIPLRPASARADEDSGLLDEGVLLASRSAELASGTDRARATRSGYDLRSRTRTTPHGVFAGVAAAALTASASVLRMGGAHQAVTTLSPAWLRAAASRLLHEEPGLLPALTLTTASLATERGQRLEIECPAPHGSRISGVRATAFSRWLLESSRGGVPAAGLLAEARRRHPGAEESMVRRAVLDMIDTGLLLSDVLPVDLRAEPLQHLLGNLPSGAEIRPALSRLAHLLARCDSHPPGTVRRQCLLEEVRGLADRLHVTDRPLVVDTRADAEVTVPRKVGEQAAQAASVLWRIGHRTGALEDYQRRFHAAYGHHRLVPLPEVLDPVTGLGPPRAADGVGAREEPAGRRTAALARLLVGALAEGKDEVELREDHIDQLANPSCLPPPRNAEIHLQLVRETCRVRVAVCPGTGSQTAGASPGRWARWLPQLVPEEPADTGNGPMIAEIVCRPTTAAGALAAETGAAPFRIPLDVPARDNDLLPDELAVTTTGGHLQLWSTRHRRPVLPVLYNRLTRRHLPPAAYLLYLLGQAGTRPWHPWNWAPLENWPYTPRVRYRDILLTPARWRLPEHLTAAAGDRAAFAQQLAAWRTNTRPIPPPCLVAEEADRRLPLDLRQEEHRELLRRSIHRGTRYLSEPFGSAEELAVVEGPGGHRHMIDLVVPLVRRHAPPPPPLDPRTSQRAPGAGTHLPGSTWLSAALAAPAHLHGTVLTALTPLLTGLPPEVLRWFWLRYTTPALGPHLRVRVHASARVLAANIQPELTRCAQQLQDLRLLASGALHVEPYEQEIERYGGPKAITAAEDLFCADSRLALAALSCTEDDRLLIAAVGAADIARTLAPHESRSALRPGRLTPAQRRHRDTLRPRLSCGADSALPHRLAADHHARHTALLAYRATLADEFAARCASDVIHLHANRMLGTDPGSERIMRTLAADLLPRP
ncbi:lantibiotic dehydratase [Streptomyces sp. KN37]|uniref:lantibiotic dehydratase n=1 Tax=Streptomyces sp. KN37 TaxID=3090667 RepID=UPI002A74CD30|nr:lantibiotic dehydratase [Streptomyces sp. KN37]WPO76710.1 lantibiotic dehydratase [Streptomyces sp. KN37]